MSQQPMSQPRYVEVEDVVAVIDALAVEPAGPVDALGHSLGGYLCLRAAARTANVRRLVLYEPANHPVRSAA